MKSIHKTPFENSLNSEIELEIFNETNLNFLYNEGFESSSNNSYVGEKTDLVGYHILQLSLYYNFSLYVYVFKKWNRFRC